jgi:hypothetical protein
MGGEGNILRRAATVTAAGTEGLKPLRLFTLYLHSAQWGSFLVQPAARWANQAIYDLGGGVPDGLGIGCESMGHQGRLTRAKVPYLPCLTWCHAAGKVIDKPNNYKSVTQVDPRYACWAILVLSYSKGRLILFQYIGIS